VPGFDEPQLAASVGAVFAQTGLQDSWQDLLPKKGKGLADV